MENRAVVPGIGQVLVSATMLRLDTQGCTDIGLHYAVTLRAWRAAWERERAAILALGYSERYWRKFR